MSYRGRPSRKGSDYRDAPVQAAGAVADDCDPAVPQATQSASPDRISVQEQLERILESDEFQGSERICWFLRYVVEETLQGRSKRKKAFPVAIAAFDRDETFNPQTDPIVRIEAGRLRRRLERYYLVTGAGDDIWIEIPRGSYAPVLSWKSAEPAYSSAESGATPQEAVPAVVLPWRWE